MKSVLKKIKSMFKKKEATLKHSKTFVGSRSSKEINTTKRSGTFSGPEKYKDFGEKLNKSFAIRSARDTEGAIKEYCSGLYSYCKNLAGKFESGKVYKKPIFINSYIFGCMNIISNAYLASDALLSFVKRNGSVGKYKPESLSNEMEKLREITETLAKFSSTNNINLLNKVSVCNNDLTTLMGYIINSSFKNGITLLINKLNCKKIKDIWNKSITFNGSVKKILDSLKNKTVDLSKDKSAKKDIDYIKQHIKHIKKHNLESWILPYFKDKDIDTKNLTSIFNDIVGNDGKLNKINKQISNYERDISVFDVDQTKKVEFSGHLDAFMTYLKTVSLNS